MKIILVGPPASGKGSQAELLAKKFKLKHISAGALLRKEKKKNTERGRLIKELIDNGKFAPNKITNELMKEAITENCILDGYPRNINQAKFLESYVKIDHVFLIKAGEEIIYKRLSARRTCVKCGAVYNLITKPSKLKGKCDECGGDFYIREDDTKEGIKERLRLYNQNTKPLIDYYKKKGILREIDGEQLLDKVFNDIISYL